MNFLANAYLLCALLCLVMASFVTGRHEKSSTRDAFLRNISFSFIWQLMTYFVLTAPSQEIATLYSKIAYLGCIFLSLTSYDVIVHFLELDYQKKIIKWSYVIGALIFFPMLFSDLLLEPAYLYSWGYWFNAGKLHPLYLVYFSIFGVLTFANLAVHSRRITNRVERNKCRFLFFVYLISYCSIVDFFPDYGFAVYPLGFLFGNVFLLSVWIVIKVYDFFYMWKKVFYVEKSSYNTTSEEHKSVSRQSKILT